MPSSFIALQVLLILLPGFAASSIVRALAVRAKQTDFGQVVDACLYSLLIYTAFVVLAAGRLPFSVQRVSAGSSDFATIWHPRALLGLTSTTLLVAVTAVLYINHDWNRALRRLRLTERTTRQSIWNDVFQSVAKTQQAVQVELEGNRSVLGILSYYSDDAEECSIYLRQAEWVSESGENQKIPGDGILLTRNSGIKSVSLLDLPK